MNTISPAPLPALVTVVGDRHANTVPEMDNSLDSKFRLRDRRTNEVVCGFDRGWSIHVTTNAARTFSAPSSDEFGTSI